MHLWGLVSSVTVFYLGTHQPGWLARVDVPLFVSRRRLADVRKLPRALGAWALDSGGFSELNLFGRWTVSAVDYSVEVRRFHDEVGNMDWAAPQDWMCEPWVVAKTGLSITEHQERTIDNYVDLASRAPDLPWIPVLQGWAFGDYLRHAEAYVLRGVDLERVPVVGVGSVCRRQHTVEAEEIIRALAECGLRLHGFGFKQRGLVACADALTSADSMAWSFNARRTPVLLDGCVGHKNCANCLRYALAWRSELLTKLEVRP